MTAGREPASLCAAVGFLGMPKDRATGAPVIVGSTPTPRNVVPPHAFHVPFMAIRRTNETEVAMLVLARKAGESILVGDSIRIVVVRISAGTVRIGIEAPREIDITRPDAEMPARKEAA